MEKNILKWYETPQVEVVEMESAVSLLAGSGKDTGTGGVTGGDNTDPEVGD